jgi:hypothetical protein
MDKRITDLKIIEHFHSKTLSNTCGVYRAKFKGGYKVFVRNGDSVGVVTHYFDRPVSECVSIINDDVKDELLKLVDAEIGA